MSKSRPPHAGVTRKHLARAEREALLQRWIVGVTIGLAVVVVGLLVWGWLDQNVIQPGRPAAKVGSVEISIGRFQKAVKYQRLQMIEQLFQINQYVQLAQSFGADAQTLQYYQQQYSSLSAQLEQPDTIGRQVLDSLIDEEIVRQEAAKRGITVSPEELEKELQQAFGYYVNGTPTPRPTLTLAPSLTPSQTATLDPKFTPTATLEATATTPVTATATATTGPTETPRPTATPFTIDGFNKRKADYVADLTRNTGLTESDLRELTEYQILRRKLQETEQVDKTVKTAHVRHILIKIEDETNPDSVAAAEAIAKGIIIELQRGEDTFENLAKIFSADTSNKDTGGDLGTQDDGYFVSEFNTVAFDTNNNGLYPTPVKTSFGFHIIEVLEHGTRDLSEDEITSKQSEQFNNWLREQRTNTELVTEYDWALYVPNHPTVQEVIDSRPTNTPEPTTPGPAATQTSAATATP
jgi:parvulin-like peptidyl-prolyl isomerase